MIVTTLAKACTSCTLPFHKPDVMYMCISDHLMEWPDTRLGILCPGNSSFPLPGTVGTEPAMVESATEAKPPSKKPDVLSEPLARNRQGDLLRQYVKLSDKVCRPGAQISWHHHYYHTPKSQAAYGHSVIKTITLGVFIHTFVETSFIMLVCMCTH